MKYVYLLPDSIRNVAKIIFFFFLRGVYLKNVEKKLEISYILLGTEYNRFNQYYRIFYSKPKHFDLKNYRKVSQIK